MNPPTFEQLPEMVSRILEKVEALEKLLLEKTLAKEAQEEMLTIKEAAIFLDLSISTLYSKVCRKEIQVHKPGKRLYFQKSELVEWIKGGQKKPVTYTDLASTELLLHKRLRHARRSG